MIYKENKSNQAAKRAGVAVRCHDKAYGKRLQTWVGWGLLALGTAAATHSALASPIGAIDSVKKQNEYWTISGWACEPGAGAALQLKLLLNDVPAGIAQFSNEPAEEAIHQQCGTTAGSGIPHRFSVSYNGPIGGQNIRIDAVNKNAQSTALVGSNEFGLPVIDPEAVIASAHKVLVLVGHEDDEIWFTPVIGKYCSSVGKTCRVVAIANAVPDTSELVNAKALLPTGYEGGTFYTGPGTKSPHFSLNRGKVQATGLGLGSLNNVVKNEIDKFAPDVILTFDPRNVSSCHTEHRALGQAVIEGVNAYSGAKFNKSNLFLFADASTQTVDKPVCDSASNAAGQSQAIDKVVQAVGALSAPACSSVILSPNSIPASGGSVSAQVNCTGSNLSYAWSVNGIAYPGNQATNAAPVGVNTSNAPNFYAVCVNATNSLGQSYQCAQLVQAAAIPIAPTCSRPSLTPSSLPASGGTVTARTSCSNSGQGLYYTWTVNDAPFSVTYQPVQSAPVGVNGTATPQYYNVCVVANDSNGQSEKACSWLTQAGAASVPPAAPTIGRATRLSNGTSISVPFTPGAMGTGTLINYTASCGTGLVNGYGSPIIVTGLLATQPYMCKVRAVTTAGTGAWSDYADPVY